MNKPLAATAILALAGSNCTSGIEMTNEPSPRLDLQAAPEVMAICEALRTATEVPDGLSLGTEFRGMSSRSASGTSGTEAQVSRAVTAETWSVQCDWTAQTDIILATPLSALARQLFDSLRDRDLRDIIFAERNDHRSPARRTYTDHFAQDPETGDTRTQMGGPDGIVDGIVEENDAGEENEIYSAPPRLEGSNDVRSRPRVEAMHRNAAKIRAAQERVRARASEVAKIFRVSR